MTPPNLIFCLWATIESTIWHGSFRGEELQSDSLHQRPGSVIFSILAPRQLREFRFTLSLSALNLKPCQDVCGIGNVRT